MPESSLLVPNYVIQGSYGELKKVTSQTGGGTNEVLTLEVSATGGTFTLTFGGQTTGAIAYNAAASAVITALNALTNVAPGDIVGAGGALATSPVTLTFAATYANTDPPPMTVDYDLLTGPGTPNATLVVTTEGALPGTDLFLANVHEVKGKFTTNKIEVRRSGTRRMAYKRGVITGDGTITEYKVTSDFLQVFVNEFHNELNPPADIVLDVILDDPEALGTEQLRLSGVKLWEIDFGWKVGDMVDEAIPFTFEDATLVQAVVGSMTGRSIFAGG